MNVVNRLFGGRAARPRSLGQPNRFVDYGLLASELDGCLDSALREEKPYPFAKQEFRDPVVLPTRLSSNILVHFHPLFRLFRGVLSGRDAYLFGSGPSINRLKRVSKPPDAVFIGTKGIFHHRSIRSSLDFYFFGDRYDRPGDPYSIRQQDYLDDLRRDRSVVKLASCTRQGQYLVPHGIYDAEVTSLVRDHRVVPFDTVNGFEIHETDIEASPLPAIAIIFPAVVFAIHCGARKLFLVGCDCTEKEHFYGRVHEPGLPVEVLIEQFEKIANLFGVDIAVVNPVALKLFEAVHTDRL